VTAPEPLDHERVQTLAADIMRPIVAHYRSSATAHSNVLEVLNALAFATAATIAGTGSRDGRRQARKFFDQALEQNIREVIIGQAGQGP
jgi:hypothetical protein